MNPTHVRCMLFLRGVTLFMTGVFFSLCVCIPPPLHRYETGRIVGIEPDEAARLGDPNRRRFVYVNAPMPA